MTLAALLLLACGGAAPAAPGGAAPASPPVPVKVLALTPEALDRTWEATGTVEAERSVEIKPETSGQVLQVAFSDGDAVAAGTLLVRLRDADARASLADARARWDLAKMDLGRARTLHEREDLSQADLDRAVANESLARAAMDRAEEGLRRTRVVAPFAGVLGKREVSEGAVVDPSRRLTRLEDLAHLVVDLALPERALPALALEQAAQGTVEASAVTGRVSYIAPRVDTALRTVDVRVRLDTPQGIRPGQSATMRIVTDTVATALLVPTEAVVQSAKGAALYVLGADNTVGLRAIRTGDRQADRVEVREGVSAGEQVVIEGLARLRPGAAVTVQP